MLEFPYDAILEEVTNTIAHDAVIELAITIGRDLARNPNKNYSELANEIIHLKGLVWPQDAERLAALRVIGALLGSFEEEISVIAEEQHQAMEC